MSHSIQRMEGKNPSNAIRLSLFIIIAIANLLIIVLTIEGGYFLCTIVALIQLGIFGITCIPYAISYYLFKRDHPSKQRLIWGWICFGLFLSANSILLTASIIELCKPHHWPFG